MEWKSRSDLRAIALAVLLVSPARADDPRANEHFQLGSTAYANKDFSTARREFAAAYELDPSSQNLWSWAQAERMSGRCEEALPLYRKYRDGATTAAKIKYASDYIEQCESAMPPPWYTNKLGGALAISGVVALGVGVGFVTVSHRTESDAYVLPENIGEFEKQLDRASVQRTIGAVSLGVGLALIAGGVTVYVLHSRQHEQQIVAGTDGRTVFVGARF